jgi:hypothetical protein
MKGFSIDDLVKLAAFGAGFAVDAGAFSPDELCKIASHANGQGSRITIRGGGLTLDDMTRIASHGGKGAIYFDP